MRGAVCCHLRCGREGPGTRCVSGRCPKFPGILLTEWSQSLMLQLHISTGLLWKESHSKGPLVVIIPNPCQSEITPPGPHNEAGVKIAQRENKTSGGYRLKSGPSLGLCFAEHLSLRAAAELKPRSGICWCSALTGSREFCGRQSCRARPQGLGAPCAR